MIGVGLNLGQLALGLLPDAVAFLRGFFASGFFHGFDFDPDVGQPGFHGGGAGFGISAHFGCILNPFADLDGARRDVGAALFGDEKSQCGDEDGEVGPLPGGHVLFAAAFPVRGRLSSGRALLRRNEASQAKQERQAEGRSPHAALPRRSLPAMRSARAPVSASSSFLRPSTSKASAALACATAASALARASFTPAARSSCRVRRNCSSSLYVSARAERSAA